MSVVKSQKAPLEGINPKLHEITVVATNGNKYKIKTTYGKEGDVLTLDVDPNNHPAWQENSSQTFYNVNNERIKKFKDFVY